MGLVLPTIYHGIVKAFSHFWSE